MKVIIKKYLPLTVKVLGTVFLVTFLLYKVDYRGSLDIIEASNPLYFISAVLIFFIAYIINTKKWQILLGRQSDRYVPFWSLYRLNLASIFYTTFFPGGQLTGEVAKIYRAQKLDIAPSVLTLSVLVDKVTGLFAFVILGVGAFLLSHSIIVQSKTIAILFCFIFLICLSALGFFLIPTFSSVCGTIARFFIHLFGLTRFKIYLDRLLNVTRLYEYKYRLITKTILIGVIFQSLNTLAVFSLVKALGLMLSYTDLLWIYALVSIVLLLPLSLMGLGQRDVSLLSLLSLIGISHAEGLSLSVFMLAHLLVVSVFAGIPEIYDLFIKRCVMWLRRKIVLK